MSLPLDTVLRHIPALSTVLKKRHPCPWTVLKRHVPAPGHSAEDIYIYIYIYPCPGHSVKETSLLLDSVEETCPCPWAQC
jgi:hypothetical protein